LGKTDQGGGFSVRAFRLLLIGLTILACPSLAAAQDYPNRPIRLIVPFPAGGPNDVIARTLSQRMSEILKQPIVIDNRSGEGGVIGTDAVAKAAPDGYTIAITSSGALAISPSMEKIAYDTLTDLQPVTLVAKVPEMLVVATSVPANNLQELIALAKAQPGKLNFASTGLGGLPDLAGELFKSLAHIDIVQVPYRGAAPIVTDMLGQQVQMTFLDVAAVLAQVNAGKLKAIVVAAPQRSPSAPNVPTTAEAGLPGLLAENWYGMVAPAHTPPPVVDALNKAAREAMKDASVAAKLANIGATFAGDTPDEFHAFIASETTKWAKVIKDAGIKPNN
jgi:tripartite-type tricarboxylate transporter receptor subunit TctC